MTLDEKAEEYRRDIFGTQFGKDIKMAFSEGASWMLERVCRYLREQLPTQYPEWASLAEENEKQFRKAMEE